MAEQKRKKLDEIINEYEQMKIKTGLLLEEIENQKKASEMKAVQFDEKLSEITKIQDELKAILAKCSEDNNAALVANTAKLEAKIVEINAVAQTVAVANESVKTTKIQIDAYNTAIAKISGQIEQLLSSSIASSENIKGLSVKSETVETKITSYEADLNTKRIKYDQLVKTIEGLLPSAASAGLATAFSNQKLVYKKGIVFWTIARFAALIGILAYGVIVYKDLSTVIDQVKNNGIWELIITAFVWLVNKSPILLSLILFEEFSRRTYNRYFKLQEDYSYKQVLSQSFEGYKKQLLELGANQSANSALNELCQNIVKAIAENPLRLVNEERDSGGSRWFRNPFAIKNAAKGPTP